MTRAARAILLVLLAGLVLEASMRVTPLPKPVGPGVGDAFLYVSVVDRLRVSGLFNADAALARSVKRVRPRELLPLSEVRSRVDRRQRRSDARDSCHATAAPRSIRARVGTRLRPCC
jgi:hypothetical protein